MNHQILDNIYFPNFGEGDFDVNNFNINNIKRLIIDGEVNDDKTASFIVPTLTASREITIPDRNIELNKVEDLSGTTLPNNIVNSSLQSLGSQNASLNMNNNKIVNLGYPTASDNATSKLYVDTSISQISSLNNNINMNNKSLNNVSTTNTKNIVSDTLKVSKYRPTYNLSNLIALYDFSDGTNLGIDYSSNKRDITINGLVYTSSLSSINNVVYFNQTTDNGIYNQYINLSSLTSAINANSNVSFSFWLYPTTLYNNVQQILWFGNTAVSNTYLDIMIVSNTGTIQTNLYINGSSIYSLNSSSQLLLNQWNHLTFIIGGTGFKCYLNNSLVINNTTFNYNFSAMGIDTLLLGSSNYNIISNSLKNTYLHTLSIWSKALFTPEITNLYNNYYDYNVVVLAGQSNMRGSSGIIDSIDADNTLINNRVYEFPFSNVDTTAKTILSNSILQASHPLFFNGGRYTGSNSLWKTFCESVLSYIPARTKIILIPCAKSGSGFENGDWRKNDSAYDCMILATNYVLANYSNSKLSAFLWHQGESDAGNSKYGKYLSDLYSNVSSDITGMNSSIPFIMGEIKPSSNSKAITNAIIKAFVNENQGRYLVECGNLNVMDVTTHFDNVSLRTIGYMYADKWIRHYSEANIDRPLFFKSSPTINLNSTSWVQSGYNSAAISFYGGSNTVPVYLNVSITLTTGYWLINYSLPLGTFANSTTYVYLSSSPSTETNTTLIRNTNRLQGSLSMSKHTTTTSSQDYRTTSINLIVQINSITTYYLWANANTGTNATNTFYIFNPSTSGTVDDPESSIILNAVYLKSL